MSVSIIILAAGEGTRMKSATPKVLHQISGKEMLFHTIDAAKEISDDIVVVLSYEYERVKKAVESEYDGIRFHRQNRQEYPGTGGAVMGIEPKYDKVVILNGDMPLVLPGSIQRLIEAEGEIAMSILKLNNPSGYGRVVVDNGVKAIIEEKDCTKEQLDISEVNAGVYAVSKELLHKYIPRLNNSNAQGEYYLTDIIEMAVKDGVMVSGVVVPQEEFMGVNSKSDLAKAEEIMQQRIKNRWMLEGVIMHLPDTIYIDSKASFEGECELYSGVVITGDTKISTSTIYSHSVIEYSSISQSNIGPMAHIRPNSTVTNSKIGNFTELKNSTVTDTSAGHLSYLGDCEVGSGTNIGAGTITCNYDGKAKHRTKIGKNVFIGSDTQLVAPVEIADDTIIGAGSTITKDVPKGALALSRVPMRIIKGYFYKFFQKSK